jgi:hypothetical protein
MTTMSELAMKLQTWRTSKIFMLHVMHFRSRYMFSSADFQRKPSINPTLPKSKINLQAMVFQNESEW